MKREKQNADELIAEMRAVGDEIKELDNKTSRSGRKAGSYIVIYSKYTA